MRILCVCHQGNNRSVTLAHQLKYLGHDVLTVGTKTNDPETIEMLIDWSDKVILTERGQLNENSSDKIVLWNIGPDEFPRPLHPRLLAKVKRLIEEHRHELSR